MNPIRILKLHLLPSMTERMAPFTVRHVTKFSFQMSRSVATENGTLRVSDREGHGH